MLLGGPYHSGPLDFVYPVYPNETPLTAELENMVDVQLKLHKSQPV